jgi:hypothetical protein
MPAGYASFTPVGPTDRNPRSQQCNHLVIAKGKKKGKHPSPATVLRILREHDEPATAQA